MTRKLGKDRAASPAVQTTPVNDALARIQRGIEFIGIDIYVPIAAGV